MEQSLFERLGGKYVQCGDYLIPDITLPTDKEYHIGKYGMLRKTYLKRHRKGFNNSMLLQGTLYDHLQEVDDEAHRFVSQYMEKIARQEGITEELKVADQMEWVRRMNSLKAQAEEFVMNDLIYD